MVGYNPLPRACPMLIQLVAAVLFFQPVLAESIGNVDYNLPTTKKHWKLAAENKTDKTSIISTTRRYLPEDRASVAVAEEAFSANINNLHEDPNEDEAAIKARVQKMFPDTDVEIHMIEKTPNMNLYTWSVTSSKSPLSFWGVSKHFILDDGSVNLVYKTTNKEIFDADKDSWIEALKAARLNK